MSHRSISILASAILLASAAVTTWAGVEDKPSKLELTIHAESGIPQSKIDSLEASLRENHQRFGHRFGVPSKIQLELFKEGRIHQTITGCPTPIIFYAHEIQVKNDDAAGFRLREVDHSFLVHEFGHVLFDFEARKFGRMEQSSAKHLLRMCEIENQLNQIDQQIAQLRSKESEGGIDSNTQNKLYSWKSELQGERRKLSIELHEKGLETYRDESAFYREIFSDLFASLASDAPSQLATAVANALSKPCEKNLSIYRDFAKEHEFSQVFQTIDEDRWCAERSGLDLYALGGPIRSWLWGLYLKRGLQSDSDKTQFMKAFIRASVSQTEERLSTSAAQIKSLDQSGFESLSQDLKARFIQELSTH